MTTLINTIKTRIAEVALTVPNVKRAYAEAPKALPESDLPALVSFVGPVTSFEKHGDEMAEETRTYIVRLFVKPVGAGYDGDAEKAAEPFVTSLRDTFLSHPRLGLGSYVSQIPFVTLMRWLGDGGISTFPYAGNSYLGIEFRISVSVMVPIGIAKYE
jgi:hypothetical protein